jgi:hypothetical protein
LSIEGWPNLLSRLSFQDVAVHQFALFRIYTAVAPIGPKFGREEARAKERKPYSGMLRIEKNILIIAL